MQLEEMTDIGDDSGINEQDISFEEWSKKYDECLETYPDVPEHRAYVTIHRILRELCDKRDDLYFDPYYSYNKGYARPKVIKRYTNGEYMMLEGTFMIIDGRVHFDLFDHEGGVDYVALKLAPEIVTERIVRNRFRKHLSVLYEPGRRTLNIGWTHAETEDQASNRTDT